MSNAMFYSIVLVALGQPAAARTPASPPATASPAPDSPAPASPPSPHRDPFGASATMPLSEALRLYRQGELPLATPRPKPPVAATLDRIQFSGRLLEDAIDLTAKVQVTVLEEADWVKVPLLEIDPDTSLSDLPALQDAVLVREDRQVALMTRRPGTYAFDLGLVQRAAVRNRERQVTLKPRRATLASLEVKLDETLFRLLRPTGRRTPEGIVFLPEGDAFALAWERVTALRPEETAAGARTPAVEPTVPRAYASVVSTLEGRRITRLLYELRFAGTRPIELTPPAGLAVTAVYKNGASVPFTIAPDGRLTVPVTPARAGDEQATLEVVLVEESGGYLLSGTLRFELPRLSWPVSELFCELHLPQVFNYDWKGGSLAPAEAYPAVEFSHKLPLPGKKLAFHQYLITTSQPSVDVSYAIDLTGSYFR